MLYELYFIDEDQHRDYAISCDSLRPFKIAESLALDGNTLPIGIIRLNPDAYKVDGKLHRVLKKDRHAKLIETIQNWKQDRPLVIHYMYYDLDANGNLCIASDIDLTLANTVLIVAKRASASCVLF